MGKNKIFLETTESQNKTKLEVETRNLLSMFIFEIFDEDLTTKFKSSKFLTKDSNCKLSFFLKVTSFDESKFETPINFSEFSSKIDFLIFKETRNLGNK